MDKIRLKGIKKREKVVLGVLILVIVLGVFSMAYTVRNPERNAFIAGLATVMIAMLTMGYVYMASRQLDVMGGQLEQMEIERRLQNQPLPYIGKINAWIEKPSLFCSVMEEDNPNYPYSANARYWVEPKIRNIGSHPAVSIDVSARIEIPSGDEKLCFLATSISIPTIEEKGDYPISGERGDKFLFAQDSEGALIQALQEKDPYRLPVLSCRILFKNIMGGCFLSTCKYRLSTGDAETASLFINWLSEIKSFWIKYKNDIKELEKLRDSDAPKWKKEYNRFKKSFTESLSGEDVKLLSWAIPGSFAIESLGLEEYEKEIGDISYNIRVSESDLLQFPRVITIRE